MPAQQSYGQQPYEPAPYAQPPPYAQQPHEQQPFGAVSGTQWSGQPGGQGPGSGKAKKNNKLILGAIAAVVVAALVGGGLFFFLSGDDVTYQGRSIVEPEKTLSDTESVLSDIVEQRGGASNDETSCYFVVKNADTTDIEDRLVCGPVLFVDGDEAQPYLTFPLQASAGEGDAQLSVAPEPESPDPASLDDPDLLRRPDGNSPPDGGSGLTAPEPPRAEAGILTVVEPDSIALEAAPDNARIGSPTMSVNLTGIGEPDRYGTKDEARRPADGERFVGFELSTGAGEIGPAGEFSIAVEVDGQDPVPLSGDTGLSSDPTQLVISVPSDTDDVSLVVTDGALVQRLSLTTGEPDAGNVALWQRANRSQSLTFVQDLTVRLSQPGFVTEDFPVNLAVNEVFLSYFAGSSLNFTPSTPDKAFLEVDSVLTFEGSTGQFDPAFWFLTLPDGTAVAAGDLRGEEDKISIAFEVPADFTEGTVTFGGVSTNSSGLTFDFLGAIASIPVSIPAG